VSDFYTRSSSFEKGTLARGDVVESELDAIDTGFAQVDAEIPFRFTAQDMAAVNEFAEDAAGRASTVLAFDSNGDPSLLTVTPLFRDLDGNPLILDQDGDSTLTADTDDQLDLALGGADRFHWVPTSFYPSVDSSYDLGRNANRWSTVYTSVLNANGGGTLTGTWTDLGSVTAIDINGGTVDGTNIGISVRGSGAFTTLAANSTVTFTNGGSMTGTWSDLGSVTTIDVNGGTIDGASVGAASRSTGAFTTLAANNTVTFTAGGSMTGTWTNLGSVTTIDINGGTIDGVTIGGASAGAGTFTALNVDGDGLDVDPVGDADADLITVGVTVLRIGGSQVFAGTEIESGTKMLFQQTDAPTGWTKDTTHNDKALRIVSGTAGSGGSVAFSTAMATPAVGGSISGTSLSEAQLASHNHSWWRSIGVDGQTVFSFVTPANYTVTSNGAIVNAGSGSTHTHSHTLTSTINVNYVDVIIATKD
jgi:hypothetical protein